MKYHVMTLFPEMIEQGMDTSILKRAREKGLIELNAVNIRDYTLERHGKVDDYPYGGGAGMVMQAESSLFKTSGTSLATASMITIAGSSPPVST